ncbi:MAG: HDOD domain-containing protein [Gemmatimonadaceae bacterium]|nr:HDOD domain-containing protein [Gemmatimonadaceae bacterium]
MDVFLARRPIFDAQERLVAFELAHHHAAPEAAEDARALVQQLLQIGVGEVTDGRPAWIHASRALLLDDAIRLLPKEQVVLALPADLAVDDALGRSFAGLYRAGWQLALDDFHVGAPASVLLAGCRAVHIDVAARDATAVHAAIAVGRARGVSVVTRNVGDRGQRERFVKLGASFFTGYRAAQPETIVRRVLAPDQLEVLQLLQALRDPDRSDADIERAFQRDVALGYKLLKIVNSASLGTSGVWSIGHALRLMGRDALYRWIAFLWMSGDGGGVREELARSSLVRGHLCELLAGEAGVPRAAPSLFLVGFFSLLDVITGTPMPALLDRLELAPDVHAALRDRAEWFGAVLETVEAYECGDWPRAMTTAVQADIDLGTLGRRYVESLAWARAQLSTGAARAA